MISILLIIIITSCTPKKATKTSAQQIDPFDKNANLIFDKYAFTLKDEVSIARTTGTHLHIQPNSFRHQDGTPVKDSIQLTVREFHSANDIIRAGIPMRLNAGSKDVLESAGMIELHATSEGKELVLADNKKIDIDLASFKSAEGYQLYFLNGDNNWEVTGQFQAGKNDRKIKQLDSLENLKNSMVKPEKPKEKLTFVLQGDMETASYLKPFIDVEWQILDDLSQDQFMNFKRLNWDEVSIKSINAVAKTYRLQFKKSFKNYDQKEFSKYFEMNAKPIKDKGELAISDASIDTIMSRYQDKLAKYEEEKARVKQEADMINSFSINNMGIWNCDRLLKQSDLMYTSVSFDFEKEFPSGENHIKLFTVFNDNNSVLSYNRTDWSKIGFVLSGNITLIAVLPNQQVAIVRPEVVKAKIATKASNIYFTTEKQNQDVFIKTQLMAYVKNE